MRSDWVAFSASSLVIGVMALVLGSVLNPTSDGQSVAQTLQVIDQQGSRWLSVAVLYFVASLTLLLGLPAILQLFHRRARNIAWAGAGIFAIGVLGMSGYAMLMVFLRALVEADAVRANRVDDVLLDKGLGIFLYGWIVGFLLGVLLIAFALFRGRVIARWVPALMLAFVVLLPFSGRFGRVGSALEVMVLAIAFTGIATTATSPERSRRAAAV